MELMILINSCKQKVLLNRSFLLMSTALKPPLGATLATVAEALSTGARQQKFNIEHSNHLY